MIRSLLFVASTLISASSPLSAQDGGKAVSVAPAPFGVGETLIYDVKFGFLNVGTGRMEVLGIDTVRGRPAYHVQLELRAGIPGFRVRDVLESWLDVSTLESLRYKQESRQGDKQAKDSIEIIPERGIYQETEWRRNGDEAWSITRKPDSATVADPLDETSFLYYVRTQPLAANQTYTFNKYFKPSRNPVQLNVLRREKVKVPAGTFAAVVVRPIFQSKGIFGQNGRAEVWLSDDARRYMVRLETSLAFGSISLQLRELQPGLRLNP